MSHSLSPFSGEQIVQVSDPDPFAKPILRSPVLHTPLWMIEVPRLRWRLRSLCFWFDYNVTVFH